ncbi:MAG: UDP-N-acetylmuramate--L-alanine ligase [Candidatus Paracaedibacteraceae bacterium]|nr:UDP-N-acetylmuramate--L-alanine ligase [Candidatus Paracaedibacteraceae bacterium]
MRVPPQTFQQLHFVGIGGIGMSGIAEVLVNLGYEVTGSDVSENPNVQRLRSLGARIQIGHAAENVVGAQVVVISTAVKSDNPEVVEARRRRIPVIRRAEMLAELMHLKQSVAICGTHGKTTTTSMTAALFDAAGLDPTVINGGIINSYGTNARLGTGDWIVVEADESDGSFLRLPATIAVVTNIDAEHMDFYPDFETLRHAFITFIERTPFYGLGVLCIDHPVVRTLLPEINDRRIITYGYAEDANVRAVNMRESTEGMLFDVDIVGNGALAAQINTHGQISALPRRIKDIFLPMVGRHNVQNSLAVIAIAQELGVEDQAVRQAFAGFKGVKRRFTRVGVSHGVTVIDDYAHHPVEINTVLEAARQACRGKIIAVMQPHRYSRLGHLFNDFVTCFTHADKIIISPVYSAGENPQEGISGYALAEAVRATGKDMVYTINEPEDLAPLIATLAESGDMVICLGAGSITQWAAALPGQLDEILPLGKDQPLVAEGVA